MIIDATKGTFVRDGLAEISFPSILLLYFITDSRKGNGKDHHHAGINGFRHRLPDDTALRTISASLVFKLTLLPRQGTIQPFMPRSEKVEAI